MHVCASRVDWLGLGYRVSLYAPFVEELRAAMKRAVHHGRVRFHWPPCGVTGELRYGRASKKWMLVSEGLYRIGFDLNAKRESGEPSFNVEITWYAQALADRSAADVRRRSWAIMCGFGRVIEARLRRIDLSADVAGWALEGDELPRFVKRPRAKAKGHAFDSKELAELEELGELDGAEEGLGRIEEHYGSKVTGFSLCAGAPLMGRVYDKCEELRLRAEEKRLAEEERWTRGGWNGIDPVTRVEFQLRGEAVRDFGLADPERAVEWGKTGKGKGYQTHEARAFGGFETVIDRIWLSLLGWLRLTRREDVDEKYARDKQNAPEWDALREAKFAGGATSTHRRVRVRGGASAEQQLGCTLSVLGRAGRLTDEEGLEVIPRPETATEAGMVLRARVRAYGLRAADVVTDKLIKTWGEYEALEHFGELVGATWARFADADGVRFRDRAAVAA